MHRFAPCIEEWVLYFYFLYSYLQLTVSSIFLLHYIALSFSFNTGPHHLASMCIGRLSVAREKERKVEGWVTLAKANNSDRCVLNSS